MASLLALRLEVDLQSRLENHNIEVSWPELRRDLSQVQAIHLTLEENRFCWRIDLAGVAADVFRTVGMRPPVRLSK
ncbi:MAG: hypothetical protein AB1896_19770 [Thermodesulfobacteriota bacterium]